MAYLAAESVTSTSRIPSPEPKILVGIRFGDSIVRREVIGKSQAPGRGKFNETVGAVCHSRETHWYSTWYQKVPLPRIKETVPGRIRRRRGACHPNATLAAVWYQIQGRWFCASVSALKAMTHDV